MGGEFCVSPAGLRAAAGTIRGAGDDVKGMNPETTLTQAATGLRYTETAKALASTGVKLHAALGVCASDLHAYADALTKSADSYTFTDQSGAKRILAAAKGLK